MSATKPAQPRKNRPEKKIGPLPGGGGIGVAIWVNAAETDDGPRRIRSVTISPRRYRDRDTGEWRDSASFRPTDLPLIIFALQQALEYMYTTQIPGQPDDPDEPPPADDPPPHF